jgi:hypothetical protein
MIGSGIVGTLSVETGSINLETRTSPRSLDGFGLNQVYLGLIVTSFRSSLRLGSQWIGSHQEYLKPINLRVD